MFYVLVMKRSVEEYKNWEVKLSILFDHSIPKVSSPGSKNLDLHCHSPFNLSQQFQSNSSKLNNFRCNSSSINYNFIVFSVIY